LWFIYYTFVSAQRKKLGAPHLGTWKSRWLVVSGILYLARAAAGGHLFGNAVLVATGQKCPALGESLKGLLHFATGQSMCPGKMDGHSAASRHAAQFPVLEETVVAASVFFRKPSRCSRVGSALARGDAGQSGQPDKAAARWGARPRFRCCLMGIPTVARGCFNGLIRKLGCRQA